MVVATDQETGLKHVILAARTLSLAIDVVQATAPTQSNRRADWPKSCPLDCAGLVYIC
jgi:hypothetical protein